MAAELTLTSTSKPYHLIIFRFVVGCDPTLFLDLQMLLNGLIFIQR